MGGTLEEAATFGLDFPHLVGEVRMDTGKEWIEGSSHLAQSPHLEDFREEGTHLG